MHKKLLLSLVFLFTCYLGIQAQSCPPGQVRVLIDIVPDQFPNETSWELRNQSGTLLASGDTTDANICLDTANCLTFTIFDTFGDGICCAYGNGSYTVTYGGIQIATGGNFAYDETVEFGNCPPGLSCSNPDTVQEGSHMAPQRDYWYYFIPDSTGQYEISTCSTNTCDTKIWIYDHCQGLQWDQTNQATIYYNDDFCGIQSTVTPNLVAGTGYWIRIGDKNNSCSGSINWTLNYLGPIVGCMDPAGCNYNPLATVADTCYYAPNPNCPLGPDLEMIEPELRSSLVLSSRQNTDACMVAEGCMNGYGTRTTLEFTTWIKNIGVQDYYIGQPSQNPSQFTYDNCHNHYHYDGYAEYLLFDSTGRQIPIGFKNGFCVLDLECSGGGTAKYGCSDMGISAGCGDIYSIGLDCQWVDITDVDPGDYILVTRTNWDQAPDALGRYESDYQNNWAQACITLARNPVSGAMTMVQRANCPPYVDCAGTPYGNAVIDCDGVCNGPSLEGDLNNNFIRERVDAENYVTYILNNPLTPSRCNDLNTDGEITVSDAALLNTCVLFGGSHTHTGGGSHDHCDFPEGTLNTTQTTSLKIDSVNFADRWLDISMLNPDNHVVAYQFMMAGIDIDSVVNLAAAAEYPETPSWNLNTVIGISYDDSTINKKNNYTPLVRIYFSQTTANLICIDRIVDILNSNYEDVMTQIGGACVPVLTSVEPVGLDPMHVKVYPNPFQESTTISFSNREGSVYTLEIVNLAGQVVRRSTGITSEKVIVEKGDLTPGLYFFRLSGKYVQKGKLMLY